MKSIKVCHITSAHPPEDIRIFTKECCSLAKAGYEVSLVEPGSSYQKNGVNIIGTGEIPGNRLKRMSASAKKAYETVADMDFDIVHLHDPELLPYGLKLKHKNKIVIFDSHEDVSAQIMDKPWIPKRLRPLVSKAYRDYETKIVRQLDGVVAATEHIAKTFENRTPYVETINNYPLLDDIKFQTSPFQERNKYIAYAGGVSTIRGIEVMEEAAQRIDGKMVIACDHAVEEKGNIIYRGKTNREGVNELYGQSRAGIIIYQPAGNHIESQPIKLFEFMAAGLPVVASDFPLWQTIVKGNDCGICVNPCNAAEVADACQKLIDDPQEAQRLGRNGRKAVEEKYSWASEETKLLSFYRTLWENKK